MTESESTQIVKDTTADITIDVGEDARAKLLVAMTKRSQAFQLLADKRNDIENQLELEFRIKDKGWSDEQIQTTRAEIEISLKGGFLDAQTAEAHLTNIRLQEHFATIRNRQFSQKIGTVGLLGGCSLLLASVGIGIATFSSATPWVRELGTVGAFGSCLYGLTSLGIGAICRKVSQTPIYSEELRLRLKSEMEKEGFQLEISGFEVQPKL